jgi:hypothetical protein
VEEILRMEMPSISEESGNINFKMKLVISRGSNFLLRIYRKNKCTNCKKGKNNTNFGKITGIQETLDTTCK